MTQKSPIRPNLDLNAELLVNLRVPKQQNLEAICQSIACLFAKSTVELMAYHQIINFLRCHKHLGIFGVKLLKQTKAMGISALL